jgi:hypothetical protein
MVADVIVSKGTDPNKEAYSGFDGTVLEDDPWRWNLTRDRYRGRCGD